MLNYIVIQVENDENSFSIFLERLWLYKSKVIVDWYKGEFIFGSPLVRIPWKKLEHQGETKSNLDYTLEGSYEEENTLFYQCIDMFGNIIEEDYEFDKPVEEMGTKVIKDVWNSNFESKKDTKGPDTILGKDPKAPLDKILDEDENSDEHPKARPRWDMPDQFRQEKKTSLEETLTKKDCPPKEHTLGKKNFDFT